MLFSTVAAGFAASAPSLVFAQGSAPANGEVAKMNALFDDAMAKLMRQAPELTTSLGLDKGDLAWTKGLLSDRSFEAIAASAAQTREQLKALRAIDRKSMSGMDAVNYDTVEFTLAVQDEGSKFTYAGGGSGAPYVLSQLTGSYRETPDFLDSQHRVRDAADADAYLARLEAFPASMDGELARQKADAAKGVFAPDYILDTTLKMQAALRDQPAAQTVLVASFAKKLAAAGLPPERAAQAEKIVAEKIFPALDRQRALVQALRAKASHDAGVWRLPDGEAFYAATAEAATTTALTGDEIHQIGLDQVAQISARIDTILKGEGMSQGSVGERLVALNQRPDQLFPNTDAGREALLAQLNLQIIAMQKRLGEAFNTVPKAPVEVRRVPVTIQAGAPGGYYQNASLDGSRPAIYYINLRDTFDRPKFGLATLTHHEAVPGHHLQVSVALESDAIPMIRRRGGYSGYSEGWALYSEQLADEMGMFDGDPLGQVGYLQSLLFRAPRLVVDSGMHVKRWSREKATDYLIATTGIARGRSQGEIDRYTVWPGQACSYKIGHTVWDDLRAELKKKQGTAFDIKAFHDVLTLGAMPLDILKQTVRQRAGIA